MKKEEFSYDNTFKSQRSLQEFNGYYTSPVPCLFFQILYMK